ncbi:hypothetical protein HanPI659440_Chr11g0427971 [Helianthus annuus]|nr:hypothetical protein HanPI659440_Chr11g0427971 [Helianthus annuus]
MDLNHVRLTQSFDGNDDSKKKFSVGNDGTWKEEGVILKFCWSKSVKGSLYGLLKIC